MNVILLSGGSGKRLWPLSNDIRSKQFIKMFRNQNGEMESMVQRVYRQMTTVDPEVRIMIATSTKQISSIKNQLGEQVSICAEPSRRDTFPAIVLAASCLHDRYGIGKEEAVIVCPVDPYVNLDYFEALKNLFESVSCSEYSLNLMGVEPTYPSEKYGYIIPERKEDFSKVISFKEKPDEKTAEEYISREALWNCGVFAFKLGYLLDIAHQLIDFTDYEDLLQKYDTLDRNSFDYAVVEKEASIGVMRFGGMWKDIGTWNTFTEEMHDDVIGQGELDVTCENSQIINELNIPILGMGLKNMVVAASRDGILISDKNQSGHIKPYVEKIIYPVNYAADKSWGSFTILDTQPQSLTIKITLKAGHRLCYHSHEHRDEVWTITRGEGETVIDGMVEYVKAGDVVSICAGCFHTIVAKTRMEIIEIQMGEEIRDDDKIKGDLNTIYACVSW